MLSVDGDADAAVETKIRIGWNKFRQLIPLLTNKDISLIVTGRLYSSCVCLFTITHWTDTHIDPQAGAVSRIRRRIFVRGKNFGQPYSLPNFRPPKIR